MRTPRYDDKDPSDVDDYGYDFAGELNGEKIDSAAVTITPSGLSAGTPSITGSVVSVRVSGGVDDTNHRLTYTIETSSGRTLERSVELLVADR